MQGTIKQWIRILLTTILVWSSCSLWAEELKVLVESYNTVSLQGDMTDDLLVSYTQSHNFKSRVTAGDSITLSISNLPRAVVHSITLSMHSNKSSGAGDLYLTLGDSIVWEIVDSKFSDWTDNAFYCTEYIDITKTFDTAVPLNDLYMKIKGTVNSLYFASITISYSLLEPIPFAVHFDTHVDVSCASLVEQQAGQGVVLPTLEWSDAIWQFLGWTEHPYQTTTSLPTIYYPGTTYYPKRDVTLHALYTTAKQANDWLVQDTLFQSGEYVICSPWQLQLMAYGSVKDKLLYTNHCSMQLAEDSMVCLHATFLPMSNRYYIDFQNDSVTIRSMSDNSYIGYTSETGGLKNQKNKWGYTIAKHKSIFFHHHQTKDAGRYIYSHTDGSKFFFKDVRFQSVDNAIGLFLFRVEDLPYQEKKKQYTSYPLGYNALPTLSQSTIDFNQPISIYNLMGQCLYRGMWQHFHQKSGIFILQQGHIVKRICFWGR